MVLKELIRSRTERDRRRAGGMKNKFPMSFDIASELKQTKNHFHFLNIFIFRFMKGLDGRWLGDRIDSKLFCWRNF